MATQLQLPRGTTRTYLLRFRRPDGEPEDLTEATLSAYLKRSIFAADADALAELTIEVHDATAGQAVLTLAPADTAELDPLESLEWQARAALADGRTLAHDAHLGPVVFSPCSGDPNLSGPPNDYIEEIATMSSFIRTLPDLVGLTGGTSTKLDGLSSVTLAALVTGARVALYFSGVNAEYVLRDRVDGETEYAGTAGDATHPGGSVILCDHDSDRCWELVAVRKLGLPCVWNGDTLKWHQQLAQGTGTGVAPALAQEADAFSLPA